MAADLPLGALVSLKTPQLMGILAGVFVFLVTISVVAALLYHSGTLGRFVAEIKEGRPIELGRLGDAPETVLQTPELYDHLLSAAKSLPSQPAIPLLRGARVHVRKLLETDCEHVVAASDGRAIFHESCYDPMRVWGWSLLAEETPPSSSVDRFRSAFCNPSNNSCHVVIIDNELEAPIGMLSLTNNAPQHLSIQIEDIWVTPAYRGRKCAHEAVYLILQSLFANGYRRIFSECDSRNVIGKKFLERCGFRLECILRKHKIFRSRNRDSALYAVLNSEWDEIELRFKKYLGISLKSRALKAANLIDEAVEE